MKSVLLCLASSLSLASFAAASDDCGVPAIINGTGAFPFNNTQATTGVEGQNNPGCANVGSDLWFAWTAPISGMASLSLCGQVNYDSCVAVYLGQGCPGATSIACDDDACALESFTTWPVVAGQVYTLQIGSSGGSPGGSGTFTLDVTPPPASDNCLTPEVLGTGTFAAYDNTLATTGTQGQNHPLCNNVEKDLWFLWTAPSNGTATLDTCGQTGVDTNVKVYLGSSCPTAAPIACDDNGCGIQSQLTWTITAGSQYRLQVGSSPTNPGGPSSFIITVQSNGTVGTPYCFGEGSGTFCPCSNSGDPGHGCANSFFLSGALLGAVGAASVSSDTLVLEGSAMPNASALYFQGTQRTNGGAGTVFGDGLRCASGFVLRLGVKTNVNNASGYGGPLGDIPISIRGQIPAAGATRDYQVWYRNAASFCTPFAFNLSNGVEVIWVP
jgi:hypothetical protein